MQWRVPLADLNYDEAENEAVLKVLNSRWLTMGGVTQEFEARFAELTGAKHAVAVSNATEALHLACVALGIGPGDEVIVPSLSFVATANAVLYTGANVQFADIVGMEEPTIDPEAIRAAINERTRAIIPMHYAGYPCRMEAIMEIAAQHGLAVIEDVAHAPGGALKGRALGTWGDIGCFSFFSNKNLSTGEGGMLVTNQDPLAEKLRVLRSHGMTSLTWDRHQGHAYTYDVVELGYNYRLDEIRSALGLVQLGKLAAGNARRKEFTELYWRALNGSGISLPMQAWAQTAGVTPAYHIFPALLPEGSDRVAFMEGLKADGVQTSIHYPPIHTFSYYQKRLAGQASCLPKTESYARREVTLPLYPTMDEEAFDAVIQAIQRSLNGN